jgi:DNA-binding transcriptional LysR family regulator
MTALNPVHVRTLREIARRQSFSRAAEALALSQPAVSHHAAAVAENALDLAIVTLPVRARGLLVTPFALDPLVAIAPPHRGWPRARPATAAELARHPLILYERGGAIRRVIDDWFRRSTAAPRIAMELGNAEAIKKLVGAGLGVSVSSLVSVGDEVRAGTLVARRLAPPLTRRLGLLRRRDKPQSPALAALLSALERPSARARRLSSGQNRASGTSAAIRRALAST